MKKRTKRIYLMFGLLFFITGLTFLSFTFDTLAYYGITLYGLGLFIWSMVR